MSAVWASGVLTGVCFGLTVGIRIGEWCVRTGKSNPRFLTRSEVEALQSSARAEAEEPLP